MVHTGPAGCSFQHFSTRWCREAAVSTAELQKIKQLPCGSGLHMPNNPTAKLSLSPQRSWICETLIKRILIDASLFSFLFRLRIDYPLLSQVLILFCTDMPSYVLTPKCQSLWPLSLSLSLFLWLSLFFFHLESTAGCLDLTSSSVSHTHSYCGQCIVTLEKVKELLFFRKTIMLFFI